MPPKKKSKAKQFCKGKRRRSNPINKAGDEVIGDVKEVSTFQP